MCRSECCKIIKYFFLIYLLVCFAQCIYGQNLIINNDFNKSESQNKFPRNWNKVTVSSSPDYYHQSVERLKSNRRNPEKTPAKSGKRFIGLHLIYGKHREFIQCEIINKLEQDKLYFFSFYIRLSDNAKYATNSIGALFTCNELKELCQIDVANMKPDLVNEKKQFINEDGWLKVCGKYAATGNEKFITIGCFEPIKPITYSLINLGRNFSSRTSSLDKNNSAYYLFDAFWLFEYNDSISCNCDIIMHQTIAEPTLSEHIAINNIEKEDSINTISLVLDKINFNTGSHTINTTDTIYLDEVYKTIIKYSFNEITIIGHTDNVGDYYENIKLSLDRAKTIAT